MLLTFDFPVSSVGNIRVGLGIWIKLRELKDFGLGLGTNLGHNKDTIHLF